MKMIELAVEYRQSGQLLKDRILQLQDQLTSAKLSRMEEYRLQGRINALQKMYREVNEVAVVMERYYDRGYKRNGRYSV